MGALGIDETVLNSANNLNKKQLRHRRNGNDETSVLSSLSISCPRSCHDKRRHPSVTALSHFSIWYHAKLILRQSVRLIRFLVCGTPKWLREFFRLLCFVAALLPAFIVFTWHYLSCDRFCVSYKENGTSRHFLDIYGSRDHMRSDASEAPAKKPVVVFLTGGAWIIGYKMWGTLLARALVPSGVLVIIPDYRNFPQANVDDMISDVDLAIQWVMANCGDYGGDPNEVVLVGQSAGAHLGACALLRKINSELRENSSKSTNTSWKCHDIKGFVPVSGPYNLVAMQDHFHRRGLDRNIVSAIFSNRIEDYSPTHMLHELQKTFGRNAGKLFPPICVIHGDADKSVPHEGAIEFVSCLTDIGADTTMKLYKGWSHTDPILEAPMDGDQRLHIDIYNLVKLWTSGETTMPDFYSESVYCQRICPAFLIPLGRYCNPF